MDKINWCLKQKKGIELISLKEHLGEAYMKESDESLEACLKILGKWKLITGYYACYNSFYAILMKCGIKCEIHDCTLDLMNLFDFTENEKEFVLKLKKKRINAQYYLKQIKFDDEIKIKNFIMKCKLIYSDLNKEEINLIRGKINEKK